MPGNKAEFFTASGLKAGDVAVQINGYDLNHPKQCSTSTARIKRTTGNLTSG